MLDNVLNNKKETILATAHFDHEKGLKSYAFYKTNNRIMCEDLVQDTFLKTWRYLVKGGKIGMIKSFLYHVLNGLIIDEYRKRKNSSLDVLMETGFEPSFDEFEKNLDMLDGRSSIMLIHSLPTKYQNIMNMKYVKDLSLQEISLITGQTKNTVAVQVYRGLEKLKALHRSH